MTGYHERNSGLWLHFACPLLQIMIRQLASIGRKNAPIRCGEIKDPACWFLRDRATEEGVLLLKESVFYEYARERHASSPNCVHISVIQP